MKNSLYIPCFLALLLLFSCKTDQAVESTSPINEQTLTERLNALSQKAVSDLAEIPVDSLKIPRSLDENGALEATNSRDWTSGFYPGLLWQLSKADNGKALQEAAEKWTAFIEKEKWDDHTHDLGFKLFCSFGQGHEITEQEAYKDVIIQASKTLIQRYNDTVGCIKSWDFNEDVWKFPVIIDNMMNLDMLFTATQWTGDSTFYNIAYQHALTTMKNHFREDNSSYHVIDYDPSTGEIRNRHTHQGAAHESAWSRGQAWGLYGFTMAYRYTKDTRFLEQAKAIAQYFFDHPNLPEDKIPYWDFDAPNIPNELRDVSAAAVATSGLLELYHFDDANKDQYLAWADAVLESLQQTEYQADAPPFLLQHSVGSIPGEFEVDVPIVYADYYYVEALFRRLDIAKQGDRE